MGIGNPSPGDRDRGDVFVIGGNTVIAWIAVAFIAVVLGLAIVGFVIP